jgi:hypothetical protein
VTAHPRLPERAALHHPTRAVPAGPPDRGVGLRGWLLLCRAADPLVRITEETHP